MEKVKVSPKGQIVIPKELREQFGIREGEEVVVEGSSKGVFVMKKEKNPVKAMLGMFEGKTNKSSLELVREIRKEWDKRIRRFEKIK